MHEIFDEAIDHFVQGVITGIAMPGVCQRLGRPRPLLINVRLTIQWQPLRVTIKVSGRYKPWPARLVLWTCISRTLHAHPLGFGTSRSYWCYERSMSRPFLR